MIPLSFVILLSDIVSATLRCLASPYFTVYTIYFFSSSPTARLDAFTKVFRSHIFCFNLICKYTQLN